MIYKFSTPSCYMCKNISTLLNKNNIQFTEIDCTTENGQQLSQQYNISHVPTIIITDDNNNIIQKITKYPDIINYINNYNNE